MSFQKYLQETVKVLQALETQNVFSTVDNVIKVISQALVNRLPLLVCGNGGSASDAMHISGELVGRFVKERPGLKVIALSADQAFMTAWSNDYSYETVFARQVEAYGEAGGVLLGLSTSGNSKNVIEAFKVAKSLSMETVALTGESGGALAPMADYTLKVPSSITSHIQEGHLCLYHYICREIEAICAAKLGNMEVAV